MKNKVKLKKLLIIFTCILFLFISIFLIINIFEYHMCNKNYNYKIALLINIIEKKYPNVTEKEIFEILNNVDSKNELLKKYSIDLENAILVKNNQKLYLKFIILNVLFYIFTIMFIFFYFLKFNNKKDNEINKITKYIEQINKKNYKLELDDISEDELSILKNEIYKTTINLKELAEISTKEKMELKKSLSDISHQLKTPITSINIILDDLIDDENMNEQIRAEFLKDIKREIANISFLVKSILKLSKIDTNSVEFVSEEVNLIDIIKEVEKNLSMLCDLKNVKLDINIVDSKIKCDFKWQVEAISNIVKNCIEYSNENDIVSILVNNNKAYSEIIIKDNGSGIDKNDLPYIFDRFYKGKNSTSDSIGIGLALSKTIIEKDNGKINVESSNIGSTFIIKYYK